jgi:hypothetical protein
MKHFFGPLLLCLLPTTCLSASFDCWAPSLTAVESAICRSESASRLDSTLASLFKTERAITHGSDLVKLASAQKSWLRQRDGCGDDQCLLDSYNKRIHELLIEATPELLAGEWDTSLGSGWVRQRITRRFLGYGRCPVRYAVLDVRPYKLEEAKAVVVELQLVPSPKGISGEFPTCSPIWQNLQAISLGLDDVTAGRVDVIVWYSCGDREDIDKLFREDALQTVCGSGLSDRVIPHNSSEGRRP